MYDVTSSLIIDNSSSSLKCGLAKKRSPSYFHSCACDIRYLDDKKFEQNNKEKETPFTKKNDKVVNDLILGSQNKPFIEKGNIIDVECCGETYKYIIEKKFEREAENIPILICDSLNTKEESKKTLAEYMFEELKISVLAMVSQPVLSLFSVGMTSGLVVDSGYGHTQIAPIIEGYILKSKQISEAISGEYVDKELYRGLYKWKTKENIDDLIHSLKKISKGVSLDHESISQPELVSAGSIDNIPEDLIELPDGNMANIGFFSDTYSSIFFNKYQENNNVSKLCLKALHFSYQNIQRLLSENILFVGGNSNIKNIKRRLVLEMEELEKQERVSNCIFRLVDNPWNPADNPFVGGCIITELANANAYWITRTEYEENGADILMKKLP